MPRRSELSGIAAGLAGSFASRNNDVNGYWALGLLSLYAKKHDARYVSINLLPVAPPLTDTLFSAVAKRHAYLLASLVERQGLPSSWLTAASVAVEFESVSSKSRPIAGHADALPFQCSVVLRDDRGTAYKAISRGWCSPHNAQAEKQSLRDDDF